MEPIDIIVELAKRLSINYYNLSVSTTNYHYDKSYEHPGIHSIFNGLVPESELGFSRNILLIGAGASKSTYDFIETAKVLINDIQSELNLSDLLASSSYLWNKYIQLVNYHSKGKVFNEKMSFEDVHEDMDFEDALQILKHFFKTEDIIKVLKKKLGHTIANSSGTRFLPNLFYEIVAHLFKHRFIDIIVNMNFDELLDNAIEDELGDATYHKVIDDLTCPILQTIIDNNRLKIPIYIKPHGTIQSGLSLRFTNNQYIDQIAEINMLLKDIFSGDVGDKEKNIKKFNIIIAGYNLNDPDIKNILFNQLLNESIEEINYFVFDREADTFISEFEKKLSKWTSTNKSIKKNPQFQKQVNKKVNFFCIKCYSDYEKIEVEDENGLGFRFKQLHEKIQANFKKPFVPRGINRHEILSRLVPRDKITKNTLTESTEEFFRLRARSSCLYELMKFKGKIPINIITNDRAGKYQKKYLEAISKNPKKMIGESNLIGFLRSSFEDDIQIKNSCIIHKSLYECNLEKDNLEKILIPIVKLMVTCSYVTMQNEKDALRDRIIDVMINSLNKYNYNINAIYDDPKHRRFYSFPQECIINTDLELTWKFFDFTVNRRHEWNKAYMIGNTGKSLLNLYLYGDSNYLESLATKEIQLIFTERDPETFDKDGERIHVINKLKNFLKAGFKPVYKNEEIEMHRMAVYFMEETPVFGIYFFKPSTKNRINPVYFDFAKNPKNINLKENLLMMRDLFNDAMQSSS